MKTRASSGVTLTELMIATAILTIAVLGFVASFQYISKSLHISRARTLATNLTQEKIESLKNLSYYQLLLSTSQSNDNNFNPPLTYDNTNYPAETIVIGGITYHRYTLVEMANVYNNAVTTTNVTFPDTGLKQISVNVAWFENGTWKKQSLSNLLDNPNVNPLDASFSGAVQWSSGAAVGPIAGVWVRTEQNLDWGAITNSAGVYSFRIYHGTYTLRASSAGYYDATTPQQLAVRGQNTIPPNIFLQQIATATLTGYVWYNPTPVISQVVVSTVQAFTFPNSDNGSGVAINYNGQYIELFNPTTASWNLASGCTGGASPPLNCDIAHGATPLLHLNVWNSLVTYCDVGLVYVSTYIPPHSYYLIANTTTFTIMGSTYSALNNTNNTTSALTAPSKYAGSIDAYYRGTCNNINGPADSPSLNTHTTPASAGGWNPAANPPTYTMMQAARTGCVWLTDPAGKVVDSVGFNNSLCPPPPCGNGDGVLASASPFCKSNYIDFSSRGGIPAGEQLVRVSSPMATTNYGGDLENFARVYSSTNNANDFMYALPGGPLLGLVHPPFGIYQSTAFNLWASTTIITGRIMPQAWVSASDPYSGSTTTFITKISSGSQSLDVTQFTLVGVTTTSSSNPWILEVTSTVTWMGGIYWKEVSPIPSGRTGDTVLFQNEVYGIPHSSNPASAVPPYVNPPEPNPLPGQIYYSLILDSAPPDGFVEGFVTDPYNNPLAVQLSLGGRAVSSGANGRYFGMASTGTVVVLANSNNLPPYIQQTALVVVNPGQIATQDFALLSGGGVVGYATSGTTPLPNIIFTALVGGNQMGTGSTDTSGFFYIKNLSSGTYTIEPALDPAAGASPPFTTVLITTYTVDAGTFTVTGAMANLTGNVTYNGNTLQTGALIIASVGAIPSTPPSIAASTGPALANAVYAVSSKADGSYILPVRAANGYNISAYVPIINGVTVSITTKTYSGINIPVTGLNKNITVP